MWSKVSASLIKKLFLFIQKKIMQVRAHKKYFPLKVKKIWLRGLQIYEVEFTHDKSTVSKKLNCKDMEKYVYLYLSSQVKTEEQREQLRNFTLIVCKIYDCTL